MKSVVSLPKDSSSVAFGKRETGKLSSKHVEKITVPEFGCGDGSAEGDTWRVDRTAHLRCSYRFSLVGKQQLLLLKERAAVCLLA